MSRARIIALLTAVLALTAIGLPAHARYFCRMMDRVVDTCCCPSDPDAVHSEATARTSECCVRLAQGTLPSAEARRDVLEVPSAPALLVERALEVLPRIAVRVLDVAREERGAVPVRGPPLFLKHCAFLI
jgi:hypothetical protein